MFIKNINSLVPLLPDYMSPRMMLMGTGLINQVKKVKNKLTKNILIKIKRLMWKEGLYGFKSDLDKIIRYKNSDGTYKNDFDEKTFFAWVQAIENNTALCEMPDKVVGLGVFVPPEKKLPRGTFIPSTGIINLDPTIDELATKIHCSALQDLNSAERKIVGFIDPDEIGGILNFINHAPDETELANFVFVDSSIKQHVCVSNLRSTIKFYNGYAIMGLEAMVDINGGEDGKQLLWSYARSCEYLANEEFNSKGKKLLLFDNRDTHISFIIDIKTYAFKMIDIFIDTGDLMLKKVASLTRWELLESLPGSSLIFTEEDGISSTASDSREYLITYKILQEHLQINPLANRIIIKAKVK